MHVRHIMPLYKILHLRDTLTESYKQHSKLTQQETIYSIIQRPSYKLNCTINLQLNSFCWKPVHKEIGLNVSQNVQICCVVDVITEGIFIFLDQKH